MILNILFLIGLFLVSIVSPNILLGGIRGNGFSAENVIAFAIGVCLMASKFIFG